jgi:hypothetical protein
VNSEKTKHMLMSHSQKIGKTYSIKKRTTLWRCGKIQIFRNNANG